MVGKRSLGVIRKTLVIIVFLACTFSSAFAAQRGYFGAWFDDIPDTETQVRDGVIVKKVYAGMAAERAGLKEGEIVTRINGSLASDPPTAVELLSEIGAGEKFRLSVIDRTGGGIRSFDLAATMGDKPTAEFAKLKKVYVRCPTPNSPFCNNPFLKEAPKKPSDGRTARNSPMWLLLGLLAVLGVGLLVREFWRIKKSAE